jgi:hypothetical protein
MNGYAAECSWAALYCDESASGRGRSGETEGDDVARALREGEITKVLFGSIGQRFGSGSSFRNYLYGAVARLTEGDMRLKNAFHSPPRSLNLFLSGSGNEPMRQRFFYSR